MLPKKHSLALRKFRFPGTQSPVVQSSEKRQPACYMSNSHFALCTFLSCKHYLYCVVSCSRLVHLICMCRFRFAGIVVVNFNFAPSSSTFMFSAIRQLLHFAFYSAYTGRNSLTTTASIEVFWIYSH